MHETVTSTRGYALCITQLPLYLAVMAAVSGNGTNIALLVSGAYIGFVFHLSFLLNEILLRLGVGVSPSSCGPPCSPLNVRFGLKGINRATVGVAKMKGLSPSAVPHSPRIQAIQWSCHAHPPAPHRSVVSQRSLVSKMSTTYSVPFISLNTKDIPSQRRCKQSGCQYAQAQTPGDGVQGALVCGNKPEACCCIPLPNRTKHLQDCSWFDAGVVRRNRSARWLNVEECHEGRFGRDSSSHINVGLPGSTG
jgi:hypothetical protein